MFFLYYSCGEVCCTAEGFESFMTREEVIARIREIIKDESCCRFRVVIGEELEIPSLV